MNRYQTSFPIIVYKTIIKCRVNEVDLYFYLDASWLKGLTAGATVLALLGLEFIVVLSPPCLVVGITGLILNQK